MPNPRPRYLYPKASTFDLTKDQPDRPRFDLDIPSPLAQAVSRRLVEQQEADRKLQDMKYSPLDRAVAGLESAMTFGSMMFEAIQQAPKLLQGEDAYTTAIGNRIYQPRMHPEKSAEYIGDLIDLMDKAQTEYKLPPVMPELAGFQPLMGAANQQVKQGVNRAATNAGMAVERSLEKPVTDIMNRGGFGAHILGSFDTQPAQVVKPKGGNWLTGNVEKQVGKMKMADTTPPETLAENQKAIDAAKRIMGDDPTAQRAIAQMENEMAVNKRNNAINDWIDRNLTNYIKKEMGTPEDPVRRLAEEGILHIQPFGDQYQVSQRLMNKRMGAGFNPLGEGKSEPARFWERQADISIDPYPAGSYKHGALDEKLLEANPWLKNVPDEQIISYGKGLNDLGFDHIIDVLRQDVREGRIRPEQLNKVSMEQAVRRTYEFDQEQAKKMREAAIKNTEGMPVHKEYPEGYKWIELALPKGMKLPEGYKVVPDPITNRKTGKVDNNSYRLVDSEGKMVGWGQSEEEAISAGLGEKVLADALKYEGDTMGHCVGGYCPDVVSGKSRIYSLRDARGEPHVTIEVAPTQYAPRWEKVKPYLESAREQVMKDRMANGLPLTDQYENEIERLVEAYASKMALENTPPEIRQIKGKQNAAPKEDYLPFVQDFVKSGQWSDVGDLRNTGLIKQDGKYMTQAEYDDYLLNQLQPPEEGMKRGGKVHISDNPDTMAMELEDQHFGIGGAAVKRVLSIADHELRAQQAAKLIEKMWQSGHLDDEYLRLLHKAQTGARSLPEVIPRARPKTKDEIRAYAQQTADQLNAIKEGKFLRATPEKSENFAGKSFEQWKMEQDLQHKLEPTGAELQKPEVADIAKQKGMLKLGISGDTTISDQNLIQAGDYALKFPSEQQGGPFYGLRVRKKPAAWASNEKVLEGQQRDINAFSEAYGGVPVIGQYNAMGPIGTNFAQHFAGANLNAIDVLKMEPSQLDEFNELIRRGNKKSGVHHDFPGIEDPAAYTYLQFYPELRKYFNSLMVKPTVTEKYGLPDGRVILHAITEPELRDMPVLTSGHSQFELMPGYDPKALPLSEHSTYSHDLPMKPGTTVKQTPFPIPAELEFSDVKEYAEPLYKPSEMTRVYQTSSPRQIIDQQHIDEMKQYEDFMRQYAPESERKKTGGLIKVKRKAKPTKKVTEVKKAVGGEITGDDLILTERPL